MIIHKRPMYSSQVPNIAVVLVILSCALNLILSPYVLYNIGIRYADETGSVLEKLHPSFYVIVFAASLIFSSGARVRVAETYRPIYAGLISCAWWVICAAIITGSPLSIPLVTFASAYLLGYCLIHLSRRQLLLLVFCVDAAILINNAIGVYELVTGSRLFPMVIGGIDVYNEVRPTALFGHPLANSAINAVYFVAVLANLDRFRSTAASLLCVGAALLGLAIFGGRLAGGAALIMGAVLVLNGAWMRNRYGQVEVLRIGAFVVLIATVLIALVVAVEVGLLDKIIDRALNDKGSAETRFIALEILGDTSISELLFGDYHFRAARVYAQYGTPAGIEITWLSILFSQGLIVAVPVFAAMFWFLFLLVKVLGKRAIYPIVTFLIIVSGSVGLASKTTLLSNVTILLFAIFGAYKDSLSALPARAGKSPRCSPRLPLSGKSTSL